MCKNMLMDNFIFGTFFFFFFALLLAKNKVFVWLNFNLVRLASLFRAHLQLCNIFFPCYHYPICPQIVAIAYFRVLPFSLPKYVSLMLI